MRLPAPRLAVRGRIPETDRGVLARGGEKRAVRGVGEREDAAQVPFEDGGLLPVGGRPPADGPAARSGGNGLAVRGEDDGVEGVVACLQIPDEPARAGVAEMDRDGVAPGGEKASVGGKRDLAAACQRRPGFSPGRGIEEAHGPFGRGSGSEGMTVGRKSQRRGESAVGGYAADFALGGRIPDPDRSVVPGRGERSAARGEGDRVHGAVVALGGEALLEGL